MKPFIPEYKRNPENSKHIYYHTLTENKGFRFIERHVSYLNTKKGKVKQKDEVIQVVHLGTNHVKYYLDLPVGDKEYLITSIVWDIGTIKNFYTLEKELNYFDGTTDSILAKCDELGICVTIENPLGSEEWIYYKGKRYHCHPLT